MNYEEAVNYFLDIPKFAKDKHDPSSLSVFLNELHNPEEGMKIIHVAGTNGKGSVCAFLTSMLMEGKKRVATFISPHLIKVNERFMIDGEDADDESFLNAFLEVYHSIQKLDGREDRDKVSHPTFFEFAFLIFLVFAREKKAEYAILETGMGGRLDATNSVRHPMVTAITSISKDHMEYLGDTVEAIAGEKAGIIKPGVPVVYDSNSREASAVIHNRAEALKSASYAIGSSNYKIDRITDQGLQVRLQSLYHGQIETVIPFAAEYQAGNAAVAVAALELADRDQEFTADMIACGLQNTVWPGRMEQAIPGVYLDGAHNEGGIQEFVRAAKRIAGAGTGRIYLLFAVASDKDYKRMVGTICQELPLDAIFLTQIAMGRALDMKLLETAVEADMEGEIYEIPTVRAAMREALLKKQPEDILFCVGSLYLIGEIKKVIEEEYR